MKRSKSNDRCKTSLQPCCASPSGGRCAGLPGHAAMFASPLPRAFYHPSPQKDTPADEVYCFLCPTLLLLSVSSSPLSPLPQADAARVESPGRPSRLPRAPGSSVGPSRRRARPSLPDDANDSFTEVSSLSSSSDEEDGGEGERSRLPRAPHPAPATPQPARAPSFPLRTSPPSGGSVVASLIQRFRHAPPTRQGMLTQQPHSRRAQKGKQARISPTL